MVTRGLQRSNQNKLRSLADVFVPERRIIAYEIGHQLDAGRISQIDHLHAVPAQKFRAALEREWNGACAVTGCDILQVLRASHIKPWGVSTDAERLNSNNGLLLSANIDALFDKGLISFKDDGMMMVSKQVSLRNRMRLRLSGKLRKKLNKKQKQFLDYHRSVVFES